MVGGGGDCTKKGTSRNWTRKEVRRGAGAEVDMRVEGGETMSEDKWNKRGRMMANRKSNGWEKEGE